MTPFLRRFATAAAALGLGLAGLVAAAPAQAAVTYCNANAHSSELSRYAYPTYKSSSVRNQWQCYVNSSGGSATAVKAIQTAWNQCYSAAYNKEWISVDGKYGPATTEAVRLMQSYENARNQAGLTADGKYGPNTAAALKFPDFKTTTGGFLSGCGHPH